MNISFFDKMDKKSILSTYVNIINRQLTGLSMIPFILYILNLIIVFMEEGKYSTSILVFSFIGALLSINLVAKKFRIIFYSTMSLTLLKGFIPTEVETFIVYCILFILLISFGNQKNIKINKEHTKEISQRITLILFTMISTIILLINDIIFRIDMYMNGTDPIYSNGIGLIFFIVGMALFIVGIYLMIKSTYLILERLLIDYYIDFYDYVSKYNFTKSDLLNLQIGILEDYFVDYTKQDQYLIPFTKRVEDLSKKTIIIESENEEREILKKHKSSFFFRFKRSGSEQLAFKGVTWRILHKQIIEDSEGSEDSKDFTEEEIEEYKKDGIVIHKKDNSTFIYLTGGVDIEEFDFGENPKELKGRTIDSILDIQDPIEKQNLIKLFIKYNTPLLLLEEFHSAGFKENLMVSYENLELLNFSLKNFIIELKELKIEVPLIFKELEDLKNIYQFYYCLSVNLLIKKRSIHLPVGIKNKIQKAYKEFGIEKYPTFSFEEAIIVVVDFENNSYVFSNE